MKNREVYVNSLFSKHLNISFQELARWFSAQEHSFCKHEDEDLSLNTQHPCKKSVCLACDPSQHQGAGANKQILRARWPGSLAEKVNLQFSESRSQGNVMKSGRRGHLLWPLNSHVQAHTPEHVCAHLAPECLCSGSYT